MRRDGTRIIFEHADVQAMLEPQMDTLHRLYNEMREETSTYPTEIIIPIEGGRLLGIPITCSSHKEKV